jgi:hypothetical protein
MDFVSAIVATLAAGAYAAAKGLGGKVAEDAYSAVKQVIVGRYQRHDEIAALENNPSSDQTRKVLADALAKANASDDTELSERVKNLTKVLTQLPQSESIAWHFEEIEAANAYFRNIEVTGSHGRGVFGGSLKVAGDLTVDNIKVRSPN